MRLHRLAVILFFAVLAACGSADGRKRLVVYSAHGRDILLHFETAFEEAHPEIDVVTVYAGAHELLERVRAERANPQAAVWWGADGTTLDTAAREGLLAPYRPSYDTEVRPKHPDRLWTGCFHLPIVLGYQPARITREELPRTYEEMAAPRFRGSFVIREPTASGTMRTFIGALVLRSLQRTGSEEGGFHLLAGLHANVRSYEGSPELMFEVLENGPPSITVWNLTDLVFQARQRGYTFAAAGLDEPVPVIVDGIALVRGAEEREEARAFYEFVNTLEALAYLARDHARIPVRADFDRALLLDGVREVAFEPMELDPEIMAERSAAWMRRFEEQVRGRR